MDAGLVQLVEVINYVKAAVDAQAGITTNGSRAHDSAVEAWAMHGANSHDMDWDAYIESLGPEPPQPDIESYAVKAAGDERRVAETNDALAAAVLSYAGELNTV